MGRRRAGFSRLFFPTFSLRFSFVTAHRMIGVGPNPKKRPDRMEGEETYPSTRMNRICVRVISLFGDVVRNVVNRNDPVSKDTYGKDQEKEREPAEKVHGS